jgi:hypothetical protein
VPPAARNRVCAYDFAFDRCDVAGGIRSACVIEVIAQLVSVQHGASRLALGQRDRLRGGGHPSLAGNRLDARVSIES